MKTKNVFLSMGLAFLMGLAGCQSTGPLMAKADGTTTLYCKMTYDWWKADGAAIAVHYWGGASSTTWPGVRMSATAGETDMWEYAVPSDSTNVIFVRVNGGTGAVSDWGAKTTDLAMPTDGKNLYTITSSTAAWGNPGVAGVWSVKGGAEPEPEPEPEPEENLFIRGTVASLSINADWATGSEVDYNSTTTQYELKNVQLATTDEFKFVLNGSTWCGYEKVDAEYGNKNLFVDTSAAAEGQNNLKVKEAGEYSFYIHTNGAIYAVKESTPEPESWHLKGTMTSWAAEEEYALEAKDESLPEGVDHQFYISKALAKDDEFKFNLGETWLGYDALEDVAARAGFHKGTEEDHVDNIIVDVAGTYSFYLKQLHAGGYEIYVSTAEVPASATKNTFYVWDQNGVLGDTFADLKVYGFGQTFNVEAFEEFPGSHSGITAKNDVEGINHLYQVELSVSYPKFVFNNGTKQTVDVEEIHAGQVFYISNSTDGEGKYQGGWISLEDLTVADGTYIRGDWSNGWSVAGQKTMNANPGNPSEQMITGLLLSAGSKMKVITYTNHVPTWHGASEVWVAGVKQESALDEYGNAVVADAGQYNVYVDTTTWKYAFDVEANDDLTKALAYVDAFHTALRAEGVCDVEHGTSTNVANLATAWATLKSQYNTTLTAGAKSLLAAGTANAELVAFASLYDMIIVKYSAQLGESPDFLNRNPVASNVVMMPVDNTYIVVLSIAATVTLVGLTAVILRKKKLAK